MCYWNNSHETIENIVNKYYKQNQICKLINSIYSYWKSEK